MIDVVANLSVGELGFIWTEDCDEAFDSIDIILQANARLTNVGISLHKQGQVLEHVQRQTDNLTDETPSNPRPERSEATVNKGTDSDRALTLLRRRNRLESILNKLSYLVGSQNNLKPLQQTIKLQEERLVRSWWHIDLAIQLC